MANTFDDLLSLLRPGATQKDLCSIRETSWTIAYSKRLVAGTVISKIP